MVRYAENANQLRGWYGCHGLVLGGVSRRESRIDARLGARSRSRAKVGGALLLGVNHICIGAVCVIRGRILFLLFLAEFLETRIGAQRVPERIESKKGRGNGC